MISLPFQLLARLLLIAIPWIWFGIAVGISAIETPIRFRTQSISYGGAAMLGVEVFHVLAYVELVLLAVLMIASLLIRERRFMLMVAVLGLIVAIEHSLLVPLLAVRATLLVEGMPLQPSSIHTWAMLAEAMKIITLTLLGIYSFRLRLR